MGKRIVVKLSVQEAASLLMLPIDWPKLLTPAGMLVAASPSDGEGIALRWVQVRERIRAELQKLRKTQAQANQPTRVKRRR